MHMKWLLMSMAAAAALAVGPASAADIPVKAPPRAAPMWSWAGSYFGVHGGGVFGDVNRFYPDAVGGALNVKSDFDAAIFGLHGGTQWQFGQIVLGIESAISFSPDEMKGTVVAPVPPFGANISMRNRISDLSTIGGRAGFAWDRVLVYGTGGYATGHVVANYFTTSTGAEAFADFNGRTRLSGWYAGGGIDWVVARGELTALILGVEYQHFDLDAKHIPIVNTTVAEQYSAGAKGDIIRARFTVKYPTWWNR
jgi:outer membrane immunogenic protein